jgi:glycosyltransferase involved in cell wall biosynthesis
LTQSATIILPTVSVILPTFNRSGLITSSLESVLSQSYPIAEIVVVDDGSSDDTEAVVAKFGNRVHYIRRENGGKNAAINTGLRQVHGDLVWIMDDDDLAPVDALEKLVSPFAADPSTAISYGALQKFREDLETGAMRFEQTHPYPSEDERSFFIHVMEDCFITGQPCVLVRRSCYDAMFPLPEDKVISEDYAVLLLLARRWPATRVEGVTLFQRQHDGPRGPANIRYAADTRNARWSLMSPWANSLADRHPRSRETLWSDGKHIFKKRQLQRARSSGRKRSLLCWMARARPPTPRSVQWISSFSAACWAAAMDLMS